MSIGYTHTYHIHTHEHMPEKIGTSTGSLPQRQALSAIKQMGCSALAHPQLGMEAGVLRSIILSGDQKSLGTHTHTHFWYVNKWVYIPWV